MSGFTAIPNAVLRDTELSVRARILYGIILSYAWGADGCTANPDTLAYECSIGRNTFFDCVRQLKAKGLLKTAKSRRGKVWVTTYVPLARGVVIADPVGSHEKGDSQISESENHDTPRARAGDQEEDLTATPLPPTARNGRSWTAFKYRGRKVPKPIVERGEAAFAEYLQLSGRRLRPYTGDGFPSGALKQIVGQLIDYPDLDEQRVRQIVRNVWANPPSWVADEGRPVEIGDIFGPNAWIRAMTNDGRKRERRNGDDGPPRVETQEEWSRRFHEGAVEIPYE